MPQQNKPAAYARYMQFFVLCLLLSFSLAACKTDEDNTQSADPKQAQSAQGTELPEKTAQNTTPEYGDRLVIGSIGEASNLVSALSSDSASHEISQWLNVGLLKYDKNLNIVPFAAESYSIKNGGTLLHFTLRQGILWEDGTELSVDDVEFTYKLMCNPKTPTAYAEDFLAVKNFRKIDRYNFEVEYEKPFARSLVTWMSDILPKHALEGQDLLNTPYLRKPLSSGPFVLKEWVQGSHIVLAANKNYFEGRPYIDEIVYRTIPDMATMFLELKAGRLDMMSLTPQQYVLQTKGAAWQKDWQKFHYLSFGYSYIGYNLSREPFNDVRVRRALSHAINCNAIIAGVLLGEGKASNGPYKPETWVYNDKLAPIAYDVEKAKKLLAEAGFTDVNQDGIVEKNGKPLRFTLLTNQGNEQRIKTATIVQHQLKQIGVDMKIRTVEWAAFIKEFVHTGRFEALLLGWNILQDPDIYDVWHSSRAVAGGLNFTGFQNAEADSLLEQARSLLTEQERKPLYDRFQEILQEEQPYTFLYVPYALPIVHSRFHGLSVSPAGLMHNVLKWYVPKQLQKYETSF